MVRLISIAAFLFLTTSVIAQDIAEEFDKKTQEVRQLEQKLVELSLQKKTLNTQIANFNTQIKLTAIKIEQTEIRIATLSAKINVLETSITELSLAYQERVISTYRLRRLGDPFLLLLGAQDLPSLFTRLHYLRLIRTRDEDLLTRLQTSQVNLEHEKTELEELERELEVQRAFLARQRGAKEKLLEITKNDERRYQELLQRARAEQAAIAAAMRNAVNLLRDGQPVKKGSTIALIGNSGAPGCSTGPHLHLEIQKDGTSVDPAGYLSARDVIWDNTPDPPFSFSGQLPWPIETPRITQGFGMTYWAKTGFYGGRPHTGLDMTSDSLSIRSPVDGTLYKGTISCSGSPMNFVAVDHGSATISWYWHVQ